MLKFCNVSDIAQYGPKNEIFVEGKLIREGFTKRLRKKSGDLPKLPRPPTPALVFLRIKN